VKAPNVLLLVVLAAAVGYLVYDSPAEVARKEAEMQAWRERTRACEAAGGWMDWKPLHAPCLMKVKPRPQAADGG